MLRLLVNTVGFTVPPERFLAGVRRMEHSDLAVTLIAAPSKTCEDLTDCCPFELKIHKTDGDLLTALRTVIGTITDEWLILLDGSDLLPADFAVRITPLLQDCDAVVFNTITLRAGNQPQRLFMRSDTALSDLLSKEQTAVAAIRTEIARRVMETIDETVRTPSDAVRAMLRACSSPRIHSDIPIYRTLAETSAPPAISAANAQFRSALFDAAYPVITSPLSYTAWHRLKKVKEQLRRK